MTLVSRRQLLMQIRYLQAENDRLVNGWAKTLADYGLLIVKTKHHQQKGST